MRGTPLWGQEKGVGTLPLGPRADILHCGALRSPLAHACTGVRACGSRKAEIWSAAPGKSAHAHKLRLHGLQRLR